MMRVFFTILVTLTVGVIELFDHSPWSTSARDKLGALATNMWTGKELRIRVVDVDEETVRKALPLDRANAWWLANLPFIEARLLEEPTIAQATVQRCRDAGMATGCFQIDVRGRSVEYYTTSPQGVWLVSNDGVFIRAGKSLTTQDLRKLVSVQGLLSGDSASDVARSRFFAVRRTLESYKSVANAAVREVALVDEGELLLSLTNPPLTVRVSLATDDNMDTLEAEAGRLAKLMKEFDGRSSQIELVDLVYPKMAVVRFRKALETEQSTEKSSLHKAD